MPKATRSTGVSAALCVDKHVVARLSVQVAALFCFVIQFKPRHSRLLLALALAREADERKGIPAEDRGWRSREEIGALIETLPGPGHRLRPTGVTASASELFRHAREAVQNCDDALEALPRVFLQRRRGRGLRLSPELHLTINVGVGK